jgi:hypothetical protein
MSVFENVPEFKISPNNIGSVFSRVKSVHVGEDRKENGSSA